MTYHIHTVRILNTFGDDIGYRGGGGRGVY